MGVWQATFSNNHNCKNKKSIISSPFPIYALLLFQVIKGFLLIITVCVFMSFALSKGLGRIGNSLFK